MELLWPACTAFLLSFLVARLVSLILSNHDDDVINKGFNRADDVSTNHGEEKPSKKKKKKDRVKFVDSVPKLAKIQPCDNDKVVVNSLVDLKEDDKLVTGENVSDRIISNNDEIDRVDNIIECERIIDLVVGNEEGMLTDEDEWEGIEKSNLEKEFARAKGFVEFDYNQSRIEMLDNDVMMQLNGLEKVAMEGPCHEPQPMPLKFFARAKWNAWQRLGNMSPEEAMERYITVLSVNVPDWMENNSYVESKSNSFKEKVHSSVDAHGGTSLDEQSGGGNLRTSKLNDLNHVSTTEDQDKD